MGLQSKTLSLVYLLIQCPKSTCVSLFRSTSLSHISKQQILYLQSKIGLAPHSRACVLHATKRMRNTHKTTICFIFYLMWNLDLYFQHELNLLCTSLFLQIKFICRRVIPKLCLCKICKAFINVNGHHHHVLVF